MDTGSIIQIIDPNNRFFGCIMIVDEVKPFGCTASAQALGRLNKRRHYLRGSFFGRFETKQYVVVGRVAMTTQTERGNE